MKNKKSAIPDFFYLFTDDVTIGSAQGFGHFFNSVFIPFIGDILMIILTGGKTGGHILPLLAIAKELDEVCYVGAFSSLEETLAKKQNIPFYGMELKNNHILQILRETRKLKLKNVDAILATGGYVSFPMLLYGILHRIPIYLLEENVIMGRTNRFFAHFSKKVFLTYPLKKMKKKYSVVGLPTRVNIDKQRKYPVYDVLIIGGSLGSKPLCDLAAVLSKNYSVCLIAGRYKSEYQSLGNTTVLEFVDDLPNLMRQASLIISRAGASTTYEIFTVGKPCILIPSLKTSQNHQYLNALYFEKKGCCKLLKEQDAKTIVRRTVDYILGNREVKMKMIEQQNKLIIPDSVKKIIKEVNGR